MKLQISGKRSLSLYLYERRLQIQSEYNNHLESTGQEMCWGKNVDYQRVVTDYFSQYFSRFNSSFWFQIEKKKNVK